MTIVKESNNLRYVTRLIDILFHRISNVHEYQAFKNVKLKLRRLNWTYWKQSFVISSGLIVPDSSESPEAELQISRVPIHPATFLHRSLSPNKFWHRDTHRAPRESRSFHNFNLSFASDCVFSDAKQRSPLGRLVRDAAGAPDRADAWICNDLLLTWESIVTFSLNVIFFTFFKSAIPWQFSFDTVNKSATSIATNNPSATSNHYCVTV